MLATSLLAFVTSLLAVSATAKHSPARRSAHTDITSTDVDVVKRGYTPDHPDWYYLNALTWWKVDATQQDHARFHAYLSMAAYGDYKTLCPSTFNKGFTVISKFDTSAGQSGFIAKIPEMAKIVIVFKGFGDYGKINWNPVYISSLVSNCDGCTVAKGVYDLYMSAKKATNDFADAKAAVKTTKLLFSVTGHGIGGSVAALAGLDLGARDLVHYSHNQGAPRTFNQASIVRYDNLFQVLAGQSLVSRNDNIVNLRPLGTFAHIGTKVHITGDKTQWLTNCYGNNENSTCLGNGSSAEDHKYYFTPLANVVPPTRASEVTLRLPEARFPIVFLCSAVTGECAM